MYFLLRDSSRHTCQLLAKSMDVSARRAFFLSKRSFIVLASTSSNPAFSNRNSIAAYRSYHVSKNVRDSDVDSLNESPATKPTVVDGSASSFYNIPKRSKQKITTAEDAVSLIRNGDTVAVSGFVCQGTPEAVLRALGERYDAEGAPFDLTLVFGGGPGA